MVVPDALSNSQRAPPTPSWSRSEDVRNSLNVLDQVLSEFDDPDLDDDFLEDSFYTTSSPNEASSDASPKSHNSRSHSPKKQLQPQSKDRKGGNGSRSFETKAVVHRQEVEKEVPPSIDRSKKPKPGPPVLPKKTSASQVARNPSDSRDSSKRSSQDESSKSRKSESSWSAKEPQGSETQKLTESPKVQSNEAPKTDPVNDYEPKKDNEKPSGSLKSRSSCGSGSSGTHDYQEINSDICAALQREHQNQLEAAVGQNEQLQRPYPNHQHTGRVFNPNSRVQEHQQLHRDAFLRQRQQQQLLQENYNNALRSRGRSVEPRRRPSNGQETKTPDRGRPNILRDRSSGRDRSTGRDKAVINDRSRGRDPSRGRDQSRGRERSLGRDMPGGLVPPSSNCRSKSSDRMLDGIARERLRENYRDERLMIPPYPDDPRLFEPQFHDPRLFIDTNIDPRFLDPGIERDPRLIESHMMDPRLFDGRYGGDPMAYSLQDAPFPPPLVGYYDSMGPIGPILPPREFGAHPLYPYDSPYLPDAALLTPEEILHLQRGGDPNLILHHPSIDHSFFPSYPMDYAQLYPHVPYPLEPEFGYPPELYPQPLDTPMNAFGDPRHVDETKLNIDRLVKGSRHSLAELRPTDGPTPAQLVKELRRSTRNLPHHLRHSTDPTELSSNYDDSPGGFRVGEVVRVGQPPRQGGAKSTSTSLPHFSPNTKDSGFDEVVHVEDCSPGTGGAQSTNEGLQGGRTVGKTKGSMVVSGVLNPMSNMYIPAPPSPLPDYDDEGGGGTSDGGESDILKGSQFYVVDAEGATDDARVATAGKVQKKGMSSKVGTIDIENKTQSEGSAKQRSVEAVPKGSNERKRRSPSQSKEHILDKNITANTEPNASVSRDPPQSPQPVAAAAKAGSPLEKMINKFHQSLPPLNALDDAHFSDDSLEDSAADETSTTFTSRPSTIDPKNFWDDSVGNANDSSTSFDYVQGEYEIKPEKKFNKKLPRSQSQNESGLVASSKPTKPLKSTSPISKKASVSHSNLSNTPSVKREIHGRSVSNGNGISQPNAHRNSLSNINGSSLSTNKRDSSSSVSSDSAKFDTIKNMLKEGLIEGLDEGPPDFVPPPPFLHFENGRKSNTKVEEDSSILRESENWRRSLSPEGERLPSFSPNRETSLNVSDKRGRKNKLNMNESLVEKSGSNSSKTKSVVLSRSLSTDNKEFEARRKLSSPPGSGKAKSAGTNRLPSSMQDSPPPPPPPRESSLTNGGFKTQNSPGNSSWLHSPHLPSLKSKKSRSPSRSPSRKIRELDGSRTSLSQVEPQPEMSELSIYTKSPIDLTKVTHIDDPGDARLKPGFDEDDSLEREDSIENVKKKEPHRKRSESQPVVSKVVEKIYDLRRKKDVPDIPDKDHGKMNKPVSRQSSEKYHSPSVAVVKNQNRNSIAVDGCSFPGIPAPIARERSSITADPSAESSHRMSKRDEGRSSTQMENRRRNASPTKRRQPPPPPPPASSGPTRQITQSFGHNFPCSDRSAGPPVDGRGQKMDKTKSSRDSDANPVSTLPSPTTSVDDMSPQDLRRASSLVSNRKGTAPPVPKVRTTFPASTKLQQSPPTSSAPGFMPSEGAVESKSRFSIFRSIWRRNKYSLDKA